MKNKWVRKIGVIATFTAFAMMAIGSGSTDAAKENKQIVGADTEQSVQDEQEGIAAETRILLPGWRRIPFGEKV